MSANGVSTRVERPRTLIYYWAMRLIIALLSSIVLACIVMALFSAGAVK